MSNAQGSHRAARRGFRTPVAPPAPVAGPPAHARSFHDQLTVAVGMRWGSGAQPVHDPTVVDRRLPAQHHHPSVPAHAAHAGAAAGRHRRAAAGPETLRRLVPRALVVVLLAGGTAAFLVHDKSVTLSVDGRPRLLHTFADDVGELLADEDITVGARDSVAPAPGTPLADGDEVAVRYAAGGGFRAARRP